MFNENYIEYKSNVDKNKTKTLLIKQHLEKNIPNSNIIIKVLKKSVVWNIHLITKI